MLAKKMKPTHFLFSMALLTLASAEEKGSLPSDSLDLLAKLQQFETNERTKFETAVLEKRKAVIAVLEKHLDRETKSGNLDGALQLRKAIEGLATIQPPVSDPGANSPAVEDKDSFAKWLTGKKFTHTDTHGRRILTFERRKLIYQTIDADRTKEVEFEIVDSRTVTYSDGAPWRLTFSPDLQSYVARRLDTNKDYRGLPLEESP